MGVTMYEWVDIGSRNSIAEVACWNEAKKTVLSNDDWITSPRAIDATKGSMPDEDSPAYNPYIPVTYPKAP